MEDLAFVVMIVMLLLLLSGPITIGLTSERAQLFTADRLALKILRRVIALTLESLESLLRFSFYLRDCH